MVAHEENEIVETFEYDNAEYAEAEWEAAAAEWAEDVAEWLSGGFINILIIMITFKNYLTFLIILDF